MCLRMLTNKIWQCLLKYKDHKDIVWTPRPVDSITKISMKLSKYVSLLFSLDKPRVHIIGDEIFAQVATDINC